MTYRVIKFFKKRAIIDWVCGPAYYTPLVYVENTRYNIIMTNEALDDIDITVMVIKDYLII